MRLAFALLALLTVAFSTVPPCVAETTGGKKGTPANAEQEVFFESRVRPLLVEHCIECHGPDDQSGELRLDRRIHFQKGGGSGPVVSPGNPEASRLNRAVGYQDNGLQMPPDNKLSDEAIEIFRQWVAQGAYWPEDSGPEAEVAESMSPAEQIEAQRDAHWSYQPIVASDPPEVEQPDGKTLSAIDRFVRARLSRAEMAANPPAEDSVLIRRAYFTLLGLPPTYDEVQSYVADQDPDKFERLIDRLLDNPHYGERWARHWLDIARYGDTKGYLAGNQETRYPFAFTYRDYVIDAFNSDKPFDRFIVEQLAADQLGLEGDDREALAAMGFLTVGRRFMNRQPDIIDDQIDVITRGFLGISVSCARCHDHKYDPVPTADYYSLYGVFASSQEPAELPLLGEPKPSPEYDAFLQAQAAKQQEVDEWVEQRREATQEELRTRVADYLVFFAKAASKDSKEKPQFQGERGPLRRAAVRRWQQFLANPKESSDPVWELLRQLATVPKEDFADRVSQVINKTTEADAEVTIAPRIINALRESKPESIVDVAQIVGDQLEAVYTLWTEARKENEDLERLEDPGDEQLRQMLLASTSPTTLDTDQAVAHLDQGERGKYNQLLNGVNGVEVTHPGAPARGMVLVDRPNPVEPVIFRRGVPSNRGDRVPRRFLQVLSHVDGGKPFTQGSGRLELARAIADPENPLTARVIVNRVWQHHFGEGLVRTPSDFGSRGELPTHPELLDHLAHQFIEGGWSIKKLQRQIMLSATWQQSSSLRGDAMTADPENRLLWHMPRRRLEFEPLRDRLLVAAGKLDDRIGGRSVMIHKDANRRGLYAYIDREDLPGLLASFDVPSPDASRAQRTETTVPQQALYLMNSGFVIEQAKALAARTAVEDANATSDEDRVTRMYRLALSRDPNPVELQAASEFVRQAVEAESEMPLDAWAQLAQVLLLSNEFAFVD